MWTITRSSLAMPGIMRNLRLDCLGLERGPFACRPGRSSRYGISHQISKEPDIRISRYCTDIGHDIQVFGTRHPYIPVSGVKIDPDIEEKPDIGAISGWQRVSFWNIVYLYRRYFLRYRVWRPDIGAISGWQRASFWNIVYDIEVFFFDIEVFSSISKFFHRYRCKTSISYTI